MKRIFILSFILVPIVYVSFMVNKGKKDEWGKGDLYIEVYYQTHDSGIKYADPSVMVNLRRICPPIAEGVYKEYYDGKEYHPDKYGRIVVKDLPFGIYEIFVWKGVRMEFLHLNYRIMMDRKTKYVQLTTLEPPYFEIEVFDKETGKKLKNYSVIGYYEGRYEYYNGYYLTSVYPLEHAIKECWEKGKIKTKSEKEELEENIYGYELKPYSRREYRDFCPLQYPDNCDEKGMLRLPLFKGYDGKGALRITHFVILASGLGYKEKKIVITKDNVLKYYKKKKYYLEKKNEIKGSK